MVAQNRGRIRAKIALLSLLPRLYHRGAESAGELGFFGGYYAAACFLFYEAGEQAVLRTAAGEADVAVVGDAREEVRGALRDGVEQAEAD